MTARGIARCVGLSAAGALGVLSMLAALAYQTGVVINTTASLPLGLYRAIDAPVARGAFVKFCPPQSAVFDEAARRGYLHAGFCPGGYGPLLKRVLAVPGDRVQVAGDGVRIDGRLVPLSAPMWADGSGRPMPRYAQDRVLAASELMLMSDVSPVSFDARYFGPVDRDQVQAVIDPLFTWSLSTTTAVNPTPAPSTGSP
jgi:conjugative transfer signal peptidase TraF